MRRLLKWPLIVVVTLSVLASIQIVRRLEQAGQFTTLDKVSPGACHTDPSPPGIEDLALDRAEAHAFLSSDDRRATLGSHPIDGGVYRLDLNAVDKPPVLLTGPGSGTPASFHPHGLSLLISPDGKRTLMVVNHPGTQSLSVDPRDHAVELFDVVGSGSATTLRHRRTVTSDLFTAPNDLVAITPDSFYVTNYFGSRTGWGVAMEIAFGLERANVVWFDGQTASVAVSGLGFANGIDTSPDGKTIYVAETGARRLSAFARDPQTAKLTLSNQGFFGTGLDNINVADDGALWMGAHPRLLDALMNARSPENLSASQILRVEPQAGGAARTVYTDGGAEMSAISAAIEYNATIVAGAVYDAKILVCSWTSKPQPGPATTPVNK